MKKNWQKPRYTFEPFIQSLMVNGLFHRTVRKVRKKYSIPQSGVSQKDFLVKGDYLRHKERYDAAVLECFNTCSNLFQYNRYLTDRQFKRFCSDFLVFNFPHYRNLQEPDYKLLVLKDKKVAWSSDGQSSEEATDGLYIRVPYLFSQNDIHRTISKRKKEWVKEYERLFPCNMPITKYHQHLDQDWYLVTIASQSISFLRHAIVVKKLVKNGDEKRVGKYKAVELLARNVGMRYSADAIKRKVERMQKEIKEYRHR